MELTITTPTTTTRDLMAMGFSDNEINTLKKIKSGFDPFREFCESNREYERLAFLKWRFERGEFAQA